jgi:hypothetical protein
MSLFPAARAATPEQQFDSAPAGIGVVTITHFKGPDSVVVIPETIAGKTVVAIGGTAFLGANITAVTIPNTITNIGSHAFASCASLASVTLSTNLITIGQQAFSECPSLPAIDIPATVTDIVGLPFYHSTALQTIEVAADNPTYSSRDGVLFDKPQTTLFTYPPAKPGRYGIPNSVTNIANYGLSDAWALTDIAIFQNVTAIGWEAFKNSGVTAVTMPDSVTTLGNNAFAGCTNLVAAFIGNGITNLEYAMFAGCANLTNVVLPAGLKQIDSSAFASCSRLSNIILPEGLMLMGTFVFADCRALTTVTIPNSVVQASDYSFQNCTSLTNVTFGSGISYIAYAMFLGCSSLTNIAIPSGIHELGAGAFASCPNLEGVYFEGQPPYLPDYRVFTGSDKVILYYLPGTDWPPEYAERPTVLWNPHTVLNDSRFDLKNGQLTIPISGPAEAQIIVEAATELFNPNWQPIQTITLTADPILFTDPDSSNHPARFYRFRSP